jgi:predicted SprT family Zn-dependent metalloprotease
MLFQGEPDELMQAKILAIHRSVTQKLIKNCPDPDKMRSYIARLEKRLVIILNRRLRTYAGKAYLQLATIELHYRMMKAHPEELRNAYAHELAHVIAWELYKDGGHGENWQRVQTWTGEKIEVTHTIDTSPWKVERLYRWACGCGVRNFSTKKNNELKVKNSFCLKCDSALRFVDKEMSDASVERLVSQLMAAA